MSEDSSFIAKLGRKGKLKIILSPKKKAGADQQPSDQLARPNEGLFTGSIVPDELIPRRGDGINFYDLGQRKAGDGWADLDFKVTPDIEIVDFKPSGTDNFTQANWDSLKAKVFEVPLEDFATQYRKLEYEEAERYGLDVYTGPTNNPAINELFRFPVARNGSRWVIGRYDERLVTESKWTNKGLKIPEINNFSLLTESAFIGFGGYQNPYKITDENDYDGPAINNFDFTGKTDIFLMPCPVYYLGSDVSNFFLGRGHLNMFFKLVSRSLYLNNPSIHTYWATQNKMQLSPLAYPFSGRNIEQVEIQVVENVRGLFGARYYYAPNNASGSWIQPSEFPKQKAFVQVSFKTEGGFGTQLGRVKTYPGTLLALIRKGSAWYYVWGTTERAPAKGFSFLFAEYAGGSGTPNVPPPPTLTLEQITRVGVNPNPNNDFTVYLPQNPEPNAYTFKYRITQRAYVGIASVAPQPRFRKIRHTSTSWRIPSTGTTEIIKDRNTLLPAGLSNPEIRTQHSDNFNPSSEIIEISESYNGLDWGEPGVLTVVYPVSVYGGDVGGEGDSDNMTFTYQNLPTQERYEGFY